MRGGAVPDLCEVCNRPLVDAEANFQAKRCTEHGGERALVGAHDAPEPTSPPAVEPGTDVVAATSSAPPPPAGASGDVPEGADGLAKVGVGAVPPIYAAFWPRAGAYVIDSIFVNVAASILAFAIIMLVTVTADRTGDLVLAEDQDKVTNIAQVVGFFIIAMASIMYLWLGDAWAAHQGSG
jgi:hypothetical protein